tara:strand:- start:15978 stop:16904 length:927 start_codon:yes stop_codon:yes gene_type:complete
MECINCNSKKLEKKIAYTNIDEKITTNIDLSEKEILSCLDCGLVFCANISIVELDNYYKAVNSFLDDENQKEKSKIKNENWAPFNSRFFSQFMYFKQYVGLDKISSVLEIGPSSQGILPTIKFFKKKIKYYFIDQINSKSMIKNGGIHIGTYFDPEKINLPSVNLIWMSHSLEHIHPDLFINTLKKIYEALSIGGIFFIEVPDNLKEKKFYFPHTLFFYEKTLTNILKKNGFKIISSQSLEKVSVEEKNVNSENTFSKKNNFLIKVVKKFIKIFLPENLRQRFLLFYAVKNLNGHYSERPNIRIIAQK